MVSDGFIQDKEGTKGEKIIAICGIELSLIFKKPQNYLIMFAAPLLLTFVFGSMLGGNDDKVRLAIVDQDDTILSQHYIRQLKAHDDMYTFENVPENKASEKLKQRKLRDHRHFPLVPDTAGKRQKS